MCKWKIWELPWPSNKSFKIKKWPWKTSKNWSIWNINHYVDQKINHKGLCVELTLTLTQESEKIVWLKKEYTVHKNQIYNDKFLLNYPPLQVLWYSSHGSGFPIVGGGMGGHVGHPTRIRIQFFSTPPPIKTDAPHGVAHHLKIKPLIWKTPPPHPIEKWSPLPGNNSKIKPWKIRNWH